MACEMCVVRDWSGRKFLFLVGDKHSLEARYA
jgi:hypothetical protein